MRHAMVFCLNKYDLVPSMMAQVDLQSTTADNAFAAGFFTSAMSECSEES
jgi:hypothetical protein